MRGEKNTRLIGWQGFTLRVPEDWDLTGFSGNDAAGYLRADDSEEQAIEVKWATEASAKSAKNKKEPDVKARRNSFFGSLRQTAKKKKLAFESREVEAYRPVQRPDRVVAPFTWTGDRKAFGAVWYCRTCHRVVIAQVLGAQSGRGGLAGIAESVLGSLKCHDDEPGWRVWALYDLQTEVPAEYALESQQLMNVYLRLTFVKQKSTRLTVEQWAVADVARKDAYLDVWLSANSKGELNDAKYSAEEETMHGHPALRLTGRLAWGVPTSRLVRQITRFERPATRFDATAWQCEPSNKLYLVQSLRPRSAGDVTGEVARRTLCHVGPEGESA